MNTRTVSLRFLSASCLCALAWLPACASRQDQLQRVAKDWCETIRASQVVAVYPLTQDLQPGDIFLVQTPIDRQQDLYEEDGFLPLDNHIARLEPSGYTDFYDHSFLDPSVPRTLPKDWMAGSWAAAPRVAFPSYAFTVSSGQGLNLAVPVSGVPVGLSLMNTQSASGSISLKDARTIGVGTESLYYQVRDWAAQNPGRQAFLANFGVKPGEHPRNYLRVVTRVYLLGAIDVQLNDARSTSGGIDAGVARPVELFLPDLPSGVGDARRAGQQNYLLGVQRLNAMTGGGPSPSGQGAEAGLSATEFAAREQGRNAALQAERQRVAAAQSAAQGQFDQALDTAQNSREGTALQVAEQALAVAVADRDAEQATLDTLRAAEPPDEAQIQQAATAFAGAETDVATKRVAVDQARSAYLEAHGPAIQQARGALDVHEAALSRLQDVAPGGSFKFTAASARSVSMTETFDQPLVVGYLGFDVPIGVGGDLGRPIPTYNILADQPFTEPIASVGAFTGGEARYRDLSQIIDRMISKKPAKERVYARAAEFMGQDSMVLYSTKRGEGESGKAAWNAVFNAQLPPTLSSGTERERRYYKMVDALTGALREYLEDL